MNIKKYLTISCALVFFMLISITAISHADTKSQGNGLNPQILDKAFNMYYCAKKDKLNPTNYLTIIDYSLPSTAKRLWLFQVDNKKLLLNTWVAHGIKSGVLYSQYFSNDQQSHQSSLGLFQTGNIYGGHHGNSLRLNGLSPGLNTNAASRSVVVHGAWYVSQDFINKYGRLGRSWGCPAVAMNVSQTYINIIKNGSLIFSYYPNKALLSSPRYIGCDK